MRYVGVLTGASLWVAAVGCGGTGPMEPIDPEHVRISLAVEGGIAGASYAFVVDGAAGEVRGGPCAGLCDWVDGELLLPVSGAQVAELADGLEAVGVFGLGGDYGTECCDQFHYDLGYQRGKRSVRVTGVGSRIPPFLSNRIGYLQVLARRTLPILVSPETTDEDWPREAYTLGRVEASGTTLTAEVTYGGGCAAHRMDLVAWGAWLETNPVQINALVTHDDGDDMCDALVTEERTFDLWPLAEALVEAYDPGDGPTDGPIRVILRLWDPVSGSPVGRLIELSL